MTDICIKDLFKSVITNPKWVKYFIWGGLFHAVMIILSAFSQYKWTIAGNINSEILVLNLVSFIVEILFFGFWLETIKTNVCENLEGFRFGRISIPENFLQGLKATVILCVPVAIFVLFTILLVIIPLAILALEARLFPHIGDVLLLAYIILMPTLCVIFLIFLLLIFYPQMIAVYINKKPAAVCNIKNLIRLTKNNFKLTFKISCMTFVLAILSFIPFLGFYIEMVWADMFAKYALIVKE